MERRKKERQQRNKYSVCTFIEGSMHRMHKWAQIIIIICNCTQIQNTKPNIRWWQNFLYSFLRIILSLQFSSQAIQSYTNLTVPGKTEKSSSNFVWCFQFHFSETGFYSIIAIDVVCLTLGRLEYWGPYNLIR